MPSEVRTEVLQAALTSNDAIRGAAQAQMLGKGTPAATIDSARQSTAAIVRDAELDAVVPIVSANPTTPAVAVARALVRTGGMIAVTDDRGAKVLQVGALPAAAHAATSWVELHVDVDGIHVIQIPSGERHEVAWNNGQLDRGWLRLAYTKLSTTPAGATDPDIDVLLGDDVNTQMLVDIIVVLRDVGAKHLFVGVHPPGAVADRIIQPRPPTAGGNVLLGQPYCYEKQLLVNGNLAGTVSTQFFISPEGTVARADASGVDPEVAGCVAGVIKDIEFPKPRGGGGVQVNYPLTLQLVAP
jgi:hypothetical protein